MADRSYLERLTRELADSGKLIEAGWVGYRLFAMHPDASSVQLEECKLAFFAGAQHLYGSIMNVLDPGEEPTDAELNKMRLIHQELESWRSKLELRVTKAEGST